MVRVEVYAEENNQALDQVMELIRNGKLKGEERGGTWYVKNTSAQKSTLVVPSVVRFLNILSFFSLIVGVATPVLLWPNISSFVWAGAAALQSILFAALAKIVELLSRIEFNSRPT